MNSKKARNHISAAGLADDRIRRRTAKHVNARIDACTRATVGRTVAGGREAIETRLKELRQEWDVERALVANFAVLGSVTLALAQRHRGWMHVFRAQMGFLFMHAVVGWCPPLPVFRRLGFRTVKEIATERAGLVERRAGNGQSYSSFRASRPARQEGG